MQLGQSRTLPVEKPEQIDLAQAARYFGAHGEADTATMALLQRCAVPLLAAATPRAVWLRAEVKALTEAGILRGSDVMRHLEGCGQAILLAVTLGPPWLSRPPTRRKPSCASWPQPRGLTSPGGSRRAMATGTSRCSRWWPPRWTRRAGPGCASPIPT